jgi:hypothetical protein
MPRGRAKRATAPVARSLLSHPPYRPLPASAGLHVVNILFGPHKRRGIAGPYRSGEEQTVGQYRRGLLAGWRFQGDPDERTLVFDSHDPPGTTGAVLGLSDPTAVGPDRGQAMAASPARYDRR